MWESDRKLLRSRSCEPQETHVNLEDNSCKLMYCDQGELYVVLAVSDLALRSIMVESLGMDYVTTRGLT